ncbi:hypothetical protein BB560_004285 [Smittium megazygosporum]|uniref:Uncharacterized protein n=1 Tax=Smittium megazygosporum TaxID=133381 RepID=A0A2T9Z9L9_9FUNG|nr:hypothetical protein BB560_004285 [Smittium megazygosporum]
MNDVYNTPSLQTSDIEVRMKNHRQIRDPEYGTCDPSTSIDRIAFISGERRGIISLSLGDDLKSQFP